MLKVNVENVAPAHPSPEARLPAGKAYTSFPLVLDP